ncbi:hypothetical protein TIFTF001_036281 [Ficus carica]|uniref:Uncharacterized protein n=1 Tax=Ficus carica TaxID=3494 RepID=A0AA88E416_FICCA|nr:hypothetical protein TIFTF001_036281 [Ficus carica]
MPVRKPVLQTRNRRFGGDRRGRRCLGGATEESVSAIVRCCRLWGQLFTPKRIQKHAVNCSTIRTVDPTRR